MQPVKIFGIGLSRTGTTSLAAALRVLGIGCVHWPLSMRLIELFPASCDLTVACRFRELAKRFPDARFIYTQRHADFDVWVESVQWVYAKQPAAHLIAPEREFAEAADEKVWGTTNPDDPTAIKNAYQKHERAVNRFFEDKPDALLRLDIIGGEGWEKLCPFVGKDVPAMPFPRLNQRV